MNRPPEASASKAAWRAWAQTLPPTTATTAAAIVDRLGTFLHRALPEHTDRYVVWFAALGDETDLGSRPPGPWPTALPHLDPDGVMTLRDASGPSHRHRWGFAQPSDDAPIVGPEALGAIVVPGRIFDRAGVRLGRGGGHYDRLLAIVDRRIPAIGVAPAERIVERVPRDAHDVAMTHLATEDGVIDVGTAAAPGL